MRHAAGWCVAQGVLASTVSSAVQRWARMCLVPLFTAGVVLSGVGKGGKCLISYFAYTRVWTCLRHKLVCGR